MNILVWQVTKEGIFILFAYNGDMEAWEQKSSIYWEPVFGLEYGNNISTFKFNTSIILGEKTLVVLKGKDNIFLTGTAGYDWEQCGQALQKEMLI